MYQGDEQSQLDLKLFLVLRKASQAVFANAGRDMINKGITHEQFMILELIYNKGPHPIQKISEKFSIPSGSITYVVDKLEKKGFIKREQSPRDRRASNVVLTQKGQELFDEIFPSHVEAISKNFASIANEEKQFLIDKLKEIGHTAKYLQIED
ncbi:MarR family transcriptional regulator [Bacillus spongiae]|uniref:MarR family transcriptional regulator n=1 Tax=Bacillus spongiae TaxID=2683610 RepID=A0ABU8HAZ5_9BACI